MSGAAERDVDLFAGPGGWDEGAVELGIRPLGIEWDDAACATRRARGHETVQADVSGLDPQDFAPVRLMIGSAPCQAFSMAGKGEGRRALQAYIDAIAGLLETGVIDREPLDEKCEDPRGHLVLEPLRWAMQLRPRFIALEQVRPVLPLWEAIAVALRGLGYGTWTGILSTERYGVPQTRERAILLAELDGQPSEPPATHQRYVAPRVKAKQEESLFEAPEPERIVAPEDRELRPWISMAEALGWDASDRVGPRLADTPSNRAGNGRVEIDGTDYRERDLRQASEPAFALTEKARSSLRFRANARSNAAERSVDEPAPTITAAHDAGDRVWVPEPPTHMNTGRDWKPGGSREDAQKIPTSEPSPAFTGKLGGQAQWVTERPATTVAGDPRVFPPGHKLNDDDDVRAGGQAQHRSGAGSSNGDGEPDGQGAVRVSIEEAAVLQGFPPGYPWQGSRTAIYRQIGDAVPPPFARAILAHLLAPSR